MNWENLIAELIAFLIALGGYYLKASKARARNMNKISGLVYTVRFDLSELDRKVNEFRNDTTRRFEQLESQINGVQNGNKTRAE